jgi:hypothetical protein
VLGRIAAALGCTVALAALVVPAHAVGSVIVDPGVDGVGDGVDVVLHPKDPGSEGDDADDGAPGASERGETKRSCLFAGEPIECTSDVGTWSNTRQCWVRRVVPDPPPGDPRWGSHVDGSVWSCRPPGAGEGGTAGGGFGGGAYWYWSPDGVDPDVVDPVDLAEEAIERMRLLAPRVGMTPLAADAPMVVGVPTWLWVANAGPRAWGPISRSATAGSTTVTARAQVSSVVWDMGDGHTLTCMGPGTPWSRALGTEASPTCGHVFERPSVDEPDRTFDVTATTHWEVNWSGAGQTGRITFTLSGTRELEVTEIQVLQTG